MINKRRIALVVLSAFSLLPVIAQAGAGGTPTAPAAGRSTDYCCTTWEVGDRRHGHDRGRSDRDDAPSFLNGSGCLAIAEDEASRNECLGTVVKCRGELFTPSRGEVKRCFTP
jgi:hypothetical protein